MIGSNAKILLVDDDQNLLTSLCDILDYKGFETLRTEKGRAALELIDANTVDVALIDLRLEDMSGLDLLQEIKQRSPSTECILLTGYATQSSAIDAIQLGAFGYFLKPFEIDQVVLSIQQAGQKSQAARALAANERRLRALIENGRDHIALFSADGRLSWASPSIATYWGYEVDDILPIENADLLHPEEKGWLISSFEQVNAVPGSRQDAIFRLRRKNGDWRWVEGTMVNRLTDPAIQAVVVNFRDITEQKLIEDRLRLHSSALKAAANAIVITNKEGAIQWMNPAFESLTGYTLQDVSGKNPRFLNSGEQDTQFYQNMWDTILAGEVWHSELINQKKDGTRYAEEMTITPLLDKAGNIENFIAIKQDVTDRKHFEETLLISESRFRSLFEESPIAILEEDFSEVKKRIDTLRKRGVKDWHRYFNSHPEFVLEMSRLVKILDVNKAALKFHGARTKQELHTNLEIFFKDGNSSDFLKELVYFAEGNLIFSLETINKTFDGRMANIIINWAVVPGHEQDLSKVVVSIVDITELKTAEDALKRKNLLQEKIVTLGRELAESLDISVIYQTAERHLKTMIDCPNFGIILFDPERKLMNAAYISSDGELIDPSTLPQLEFNPKHASSGRAKAILSRTPVIVKDLAAKRKAGGGMLVGSEREPLSAIYIPMLAEDQVIGILDLQSYQQDAYSEEVGEWLSVVANQIGLAIQNARLHEDVLRELTERKKVEQEIRQSLTELELLYENALTVNQMLDPDEIGQAMIKMFVKHFAWHHAVIRLRERDTDELRLVGYYVPGLKKADREMVEKRFKKHVRKVGDGLSGWTVKTGEAVRVADVNTDPRYVPSFPGIQSGLYVPIKIGLYVMGSITIESMTPNAFSERDERLLTTIANQAAVAFENAYLYQEVHKELAERRSAEIALGESRGRLQSILDNTSALIYIKDRQGRYVLVNKAMTDSFGLKPEEMVGKEAHELSVNEEADQHLSNDQVVLRLGKPATFEELHFENGEKRVYLSVKFPLRNEDGTIRAIGGISTDITEQKKNEAQLQLLSYAVEQSHASIVLTDPDGTIQYVNKQFTDNSGFQPEEVVGKNSQMLSSGYSSQEEYQAFWEKVKTGKEWRTEFQNRKKNGEVLWEMATISPVLDKNQQVTHFLEIKEDISARKEAELAIVRLNLELEDKVNQRTEELYSANLSLEKASRLKDEFLANMSHELRTPLTGVLGLSEALQKKVYGEVNEKQVNILQNIEEGGRHLLNLINDILDLSKIEAGKMELQPGVMSVDEVCQGSMRMVKQIALAQHQKVTYVQNPAGMIMYADPRRIKQILVNLLGNAVKFTPENAELGLEVSGDEANDVINFTVWDTGIGISEEDKEKLFQPFVQLNSGLARSYSGTGLGLSLVQRLVQLHGGHVEVSSTVGVGSRFMVFIPWHKDKTDPVKGFAAGISALGSTVLAGSGKLPDIGTILIVEDNEVNSAMLSDFLTFQGYKTIVAKSGRKGLDLVSQINPSVVLMDIQMPGIDGLEVIRTIRKKTGRVANVPIIALTALAMPEDRQLCLDAGADGYISKPVDLDVLLSSVKTLMGKTK